MTPNQILFLKHQALNLRIDSIRATTQSESGHPTSCLSAADIVATIFFNFLRYDIKNPANPNNDRFILSKGHAIPVVYAAWKLAGIITDEQFLSLRQFDSVFEGHPTPRFEFNEAATGSLGQGLAVGLGMALNAKLDKLDYKTYVLLGDGEIAEGSVWEAAELAAYYKSDNLICIIDCNSLGQTGQTMHDHDIKKLAGKFKAFGWDTIAINGHDVKQIVGAINKSHKTKNKPTMIIAKTFKGYGLDGIEGKVGWHGKPLSRQEVGKAVSQLKNRFKKEAGYKSEKAYAIPLPNSMPFLKPLLKPFDRLPGFAQGYAGHGRASGVDESARGELVEPFQRIHLFQNISIDLSKDKNKNLFVINQKMATRKAYGYALAALGQASKNVVVLDGDVKNSTFSEMFEKDFANRFFQCFIAEQNMIGVATGLQARGKLAFASTFGAFFTRAFDQIRMAGIGKNALRLCGSHCGVSIGQDGPSQMALEDIAMINTIPNSIILYPSDGVSTYKLLELSANYNTGISYLRTTRADTPIVYDLSEEFKLGGCKVLRQSKKDQCCVIAAGITLHEALKAYDLLKKDNIFISVIDLYCIKPLDINTILKTAKNSGNRIVTVEDHYLNGGIGQIVSSSLVSSSLVNSGIHVQMLGLDHISRSGRPEELLADAGIDAKSIVDAVLRFCVQD